MPSSRRLPASFPAPRTVTVTTTFCVMWPNLCWRWTVERRSRCVARCGGCALSNVACWRPIVPPRHLSPHPQTSVPRPMRRRLAPPPWRRRPGRRATAAGPRRVAPWRQRGGPTRRRGRGKPRRGGEWEERAKADAPPLGAAAVAAAPWTPSDRGWSATDSAVEATGVATTEEALVKAEAGEVVLGYGAAVRGILNDSQGGPLHPPGL